MLAGLCALALLGAAPPPPQRILSANLCTDLLLLMLVPRQRIASISFLAHDSVAVLMPGADAGVAVNHGSAEEVVRDRPDLILASPWSTPTLRRLGAAAGARIVTVDAAEDFAAIRRVTLQVGAAVGAASRARTLLAGMDRELAELDRTRPARRARVLAWGGGGAVPGRDTLTDAIIRAAGAENAGATGASVGVEELLAMRPDAILRGIERFEPPSLHAAVSSHPLVARAYRGREIAYPAPLYACGLPTAARAARELRTALSRLPAEPMAW